MPNTSNYAEVWAPELLEIIVQNTLTSPFVTSNVRWIGAQTFHFTQMSVSGFRTHSRNGGWNTGKYTQTDKPFTVEHDRDIEFLVDQADVDETNATASIQNISRVFEQTQAAPEVDALFFSRVASKAMNLAGYHSTNSLASYTTANVFSRLKSFLSAGKLRRYKAQGALIMYVCSQIMDLLERSTEFTRSIEMTQISDGGIGIKTRVTDIDGVIVMEVIDDERFYDSFNWDPEDGGFVPAEDANKINVLIASPLTCKTVPKISSIYFFAPGAHTKGDGYLYQNRALSDTFVFPNGRDGQIDSVYVDVCSTLPTVTTYPSPVYRYHGNRTNTLDTTGVAYSIETGSNTTYEIALSGIAPLLKAATKTALWGANASETNAAVMLIEVPDGDYTKYTYNGNSLLEGDIVTIGAEHYFLLCLGLYDSSGITSAHSNNTITLVYNSTTTTYKFDYDDLDLAT